MRVLLKGLTASLMLSVEHAVCQLSGGSITDRQRQPARLIDMERMVILTLIAVRAHNLTSLDAHHDKAVFGISCR